MAAGVFAISRGVFDHVAFADEPFTEREAWIWMIGEAAWKPRRVRIGSAIIALERGQIAFSTRFVASKWKWSESRVRRFLKRLKSDAMIDAATDAHATRITICKYDEYQRVSLPSDAATDASIDADATQERRTSDAPPTHTRRKEEDREYREEDTDPSGSVVGGADASPPDPDPISLAFDAYNTEAVAAGWPRATKLDVRRRASLKARLAECGGLAGWRDALARARASPHCCGENDRGWTADLDFLLQPKSFRRLREGSYDARRPSQPAGNGSRRGSAHDSMLAGFAAVAARYGDVCGLDGEAGAGPGEPPPFDGPTIDLEAGRGVDPRDDEPWPDAGDYRGGGAPPRRFPGH